MILYVYIFLTGHHTSPKQEPYSQRDVIVRRHDIQETTPTDNVTRDNSRNHNLYHKHH